MSEGLSMIQRNPYSASGVKHSFWFTEFRRTAELRAEGKTWDDIRRMALEENLFGSSTPRRAQQIYNTVCRCVWIAERKKSFSPSHQRQI